MFKDTCLSITNNAEDCMTDLLVPQQPTTMRCEASLMRADEKKKIFSGRMPSLVCKSGLLSSQPSDSLYSSIKKMKASGCLPKTSNTKLNALSKEIKTLNEEFKNTNLALLNRNAYGASQLKTSDGKEQLVFTEQGKKTIVRDLNSLEDALKKVLNHLEYEKSRLETDSEQAPIKKFEFKIQSALGEVKALKKDLNEQGCLPQESMDSLLEMQKQLDRKQFKNQCWAVAKISAITITAIALSGAILVGIACAIAAICCSDGGGGGGDCFDGIGSCFDGIGSWFGGIGEAFSAVDPAAMATDVLIEASEGLMEDIEGVLDSDEGGLAMEMLDLLPDGLGTSSSGGGVRSTLTEAQQSFDEFEAGNLMPE
jgi:hypothetical protein